jgi:predicted dehydrogenase
MMTTSLSPLTRRTFVGSVGAFGLTTLAGAFAANAPASDRLRVAVIGHTGRGDYGHGLDAMWLKLPETEIVAVADADSKGLATAQKKLNVSKGFADYRQMLAQTKPDLVAIGPRHIDQHRDMAMATIEAGARGIYMEKPFCRTPAEADEIVAACENRNVKLAVAHRNRWHPVLPVIAKLVMEDAIGKLLELRGRGKEDARGGALDLWVLGSHVLNLAHFFTGQPLTCSATVLQDGKPVTRADVKDGAEGVGPLAGNEVHARFEMERGVPVFFDSIAKAGSAAAGFGLQLVGTKGIIDLRVDSQPLAHLVPGNPFQPVKQAREWIPISSAGVGKPEPIADLKGQMGAHLLPGRDLITAIAENRQPVCSARDGRVVVEMVTAVFESHRLNGQRVTFPLAQRGNPLQLLN